MRQRRSPRGGRSRATGRPRGVRPGRADVRRTRPTPRVPSPEATPAAVERAGRTCHPSRRSTGSASGRPGRPGRTDGRAAGAPSSACSAPASSCARRRPVRPAHGRRAAARRPRRTVWRPSTASARLSCAKGRVRAWSAQPPQRSTTYRPRCQTAKAAPVPGSCRITSVKTVAHLVVRRIGGAGDAGGRSSSLDHPAIVADLAGLRYLDVKQFSVRRPREHVSWRRSR